MRQSVAASRASHGASLHSQANSAAAAAKLLEKKKEFDAVSALERASALYLERIEGLGEDCDIMADAGHGPRTMAKDVPDFEYVLLCAVASREQPEGNTDAVESSTPASFEGQRLVRIPIEDLQQASSESN